MPSLKELKKEYGNVTIVAKRIGKQHYQYGVVWDREKKKQVWKYIGKVVTNTEKEKTRPLFSGGDMEIIQEAYDWCYLRKNPPEGKCQQTVGPVLDALSLVLRRLESAIGKESTNAE